MATERVLALAAMAGVLAWLCWAEVRRARAARAARDGLFDAVVWMLEGGRIVPAPGRHPVLTGRHEGHPVRVEAVVDTLTLRKLPVLWVIVTVRRPLDLAGRVSVLARPTGQEVFSRNASLPHGLPTPDDFPVHARVAAAGPAALPPAALAVVGELMRDPAVKEVQAGPSGVRIVHRLAEAEQGPYRTGRRVDFGAPALAPLTLCTLLTGLDAVADALTTEREWSR